MFFEFFLEPRHLPLVLCKKRLYVAFSCQTKMQKVASTIVGERHSVDAGSNPTFYFDADPDPDPEPTPSLTHVSQSKKIFSSI
jgi:hypothetical protein